MSVNYETSISGSMSDSSVSSGAHPEANQYGDVAAVYDALMAGVPHAVWLSRIEKAARSRQKFPHSALDVACGTGIATELLARRGYRPVVGVDISAPMISVARTKAQARNEPITYHAQDAAQLSLPGQTFDLAISLFDSLNYITDPVQLQAAFHRVFAHVAPGGLFAFDVNSLYALSHDLFSQSDTTGPVAHSWKAHWDRETRLCRVDMAFAVLDKATGETRRFTETHVQRAYTVGELTDWLGLAGFVKIEAFGNYGERAPSPKSDRILFVAEKI